MEGFIDRLADLLKALLGDGGSSRRGSSTEGRAGPGSGEAAFRDPDVREAWEELDEYMRGGAGARGSAGGRSAEGHGAEEHKSRRPRPPVDESLRQDYANLEVPFGADIETVRKSYKTLILRYHPDKHAGDPEKLRIALEITKKINESFERIRSRQGGA
ncbi:MAG: J domain-containing protein [Spirochaetia bacterium]